MRTLYLIVFFFNDTATTEIYTLSLHDALPISATARPTANSTSCVRSKFPLAEDRTSPCPKRSFKWRARSRSLDRKSTRLNSSHANISYAVFCLKKKQNSRHANNTTHDFCL